MELEDLKHTWKKAEANYASKNENIMNIIYNKSNGPIADLQRSFKRQLIIIPLLAIIVISNSVVIKTSINSVLFLTYVAFCLGLTIFFYINYRTTRKLASMDRPVKENIQQAVDIIEKRLSYQLIAIRIVLVLFIVLLEVLPYYQPGRMLMKWHSVAPLIRFGAYGGFIISQYFISRRVNKQKFGKHLQYLKELVREMK